MTKKSLNTLTQEELNAIMMADILKKEKIRPNKERFKISLRSGDICMVSLPKDYSYSDNLHSKYNVDPPENNDKVRVIWEYADGYTSVVLLNRKAKEEGYYIETKYLTKL